MENRTLPGIRKPGEEPLRDPYDFGNQHEGKRRIFIHLGMAGGCCGFHHDEWYIKNIATALNDDLELNVVIKEVRDFNTVKFVDESEEDITEGEIYNMSDEIVMEDVMTAVKERYELE